ncbi:hypothetical protein F2Q69_00018393 [Brassica cretica]|uniref:Uncharacterized protein n=1 Tax=Brassica cretica TaxID=69181 RepID=A0A8S9QGH9_BRACR|nr:hypothetical protein F2Q69_00018393 [Brassica cretica]
MTPEMKTFRALRCRLTVRSDWMRSRRSMKLSDGYAMVMKTQEVCEAALVSGAAPISFRRNLGTVKVKGVGDVCYPSLWCGAD